mmetsp:Transcript_16021/g.38262  ORF Transcript_16021/g.38262 Transcript_16021/m.38262 type:complete len:227 (+) Transcript_16021:1477-2157(+)
MRTFCLGSRPTRKSELLLALEVASCVCDCSRCKARDKPKAVECRKRRRASKLIRNEKVLVSLAHHGGSEREQSASGSCSCRVSLALSFRLRKVDCGNRAPWPGADCSVLSNRQRQPWLSEWSSQSKCTTAAAGSLSDKRSGSLHSASTGDTLLAPGPAAEGSTAEGSAAAPVRSNVSLGLSSSRIRYVIVYTSPQRRWPIVGGIGWLPDSAACRRASRTAWKMVIP